MPEQPGPEFLSEVVIWNLLKSKPFAMKIYSSKIAVLREENKLETTMSYAALEKNTCKSSMQKTKWVDFEDYSRGFQYCSSSALRWNFLLLERLQICKLRNPKQFHKTSGFLELLWRGKPLSYNHTQMVLVIKKKKKKKNKNSIFIQT